MKTMKLKLKNLVKFVLVITVIATLITIAVNNTKNRKELNKLLTEYVKATSGESLAVDLNHFIDKYHDLQEDVIPTNDTVVYNFIKESGAWYPDVIMAQYVLESNHGKSDLSQKYNNCFGMKYVKEGRYNIQVKNVQAYSEYGVYLSWKLSVIDRILWDVHSFKGVKPTKEKYLKTIYTNYAEDENYSNKIEELLNDWNF